MVDRFRAAVAMVEKLEANGVPFGVGQNSRMNKALLRLLNEEAQRSTDNRKSRRKKITPGAVRVLLRKIRYLRVISDHFIQLPPYVE
jgi:hypothetical protein